MAKAQPVCKAAASTGFLVYLAGSNAVNRYIPPMNNLDDLDAPILYQDADGKVIEVPGLTVRSVLIRGEEADAVVRCNLDFQGRECYVIVMAPAAKSSIAAKERGDVVRRLNELNDTELTALWSAAASLCESHGGFQEMHLNAGTFQNLAHLHLKLWIPKKLFESVWADQPVFQQLQHTAWERWKKSKKSDDTEDQQTEGNKKSRKDSTAAKDNNPEEDFDSDLAAAIAKSLETPSST
eukprot:TRINITY_DN13635_c0_g1_i1.p1 TRINITY_DN13635_c0_g1~~TRINITY_DN13635_c0_g1_i1.p1  ORF type:complete len:238 (-),score=69.85 TRINITY_DN13635_c0_g1_i1:351-1064(-)